MNEPESIVRGLAERWPSTAECRCRFCDFAFPVDWDGAKYTIGVDIHSDSCPWLRARLWVASHPA